MGCATGCGRFILVLLNLLILIVGLALLAIGILLKYFAGTLTAVLMGTTAALSSTTKTSFNIQDVSKVEDLPFVNEIGIALIAFGAILTCISFFGCCGGCYKFRPLLIAFVLLMSILVIAQAVVGGLFLAKTSALHTSIQSKFGDKVKSEFSEDGQDAFSFAINIMQYLLGCCGIRGWEDFATTKPPSCCNKTIIDGDSSWDSERLACKNHIAPASYYNPKGCYEVIQQHIVDNLLYAGLILAGILFIQFLEIVFAALIVKETSDRKVGPF